MTADWIRRNPDALEHGSVRALMAGNLCRCTGYNGIIDGVRASIGCKGEGKQCAGGEPCAS